MQQPLKSIKASDQLFWWHDWRAGLSLVASSLRSTPLVVVATVIVAVIGALMPRDMPAILNFVIHLLETFFAVVVACIVITGSGKEIIPDSPGAESERPHVNLWIIAFANSLLYLLFCGIASFLLYVPALFLSASSFGTGSSGVAAASVICLPLLAPGVYLAIRMSLSIVLVCINEEGPFKSLVKSYQLTNKNFWVVSSYLVPPVMLIPVVFLLMLGIAIMVDRSVQAPDVLSSWTWSFSHLPLIFVIFLQKLLILFVQVSICPLQVNLFNYLSTPEGKRCSYFSKLPDAEEESWTSL